MKIRAFITHKVCEEFSDCQDRYAINKDTLAVAVSDGMGTTWQQKIWARLLVDEYVSQSAWQPNHDNIKPLCAEWRKYVVEEIQRLKEKKAAPNIIYRNENSLAERKSAGATFVGIRLKGDRWHGTVLGDSCLIDWNGSDAEFYTTQEGDAFDSFPDYFDSDEGKKGKGEPKAISGVQEAGHVLFLVSDPLSDFLIKHRKNGDLNSYITPLIELSSHEEFEKMVAEWRDAGMHNDDTTLVVIEPDGSDTFSIQTADDIEKMIAQEMKQQKEASTEPNQSRYLFCGRGVGEACSESYIAEYKKIYREIKREERGSAIRIAVRAFEKFLDNHTIQ